MTCAELADTYELYALGLLEEPERSELAEHLARECDQCKRGMRTATIVNTVLLANSPAVPVPGELRRRVISMIGGEPPAWKATLAWLGVSASLLAGLLWFSVQIPSLQTDVTTARNQVFESNASLREARQAIALLSLPETRQGSFGAEGAAEAHGRVYLNGNQGLLVLASNFARVPDGKAYELWMVPQQGGPQPAGLFQPDASGKVFYLVPGPLSVPDAGAVAVSVEPEAGSPAPTTTPMVVAPLK